MKIKFLSAATLLAILVWNCEKDESGLGGEQSPMGEVGNVIAASNITGVTNPQASVTSLEGGVSYISGSVTITDSKILNILEDIPEFSVSGNTVTASNVPFKITTKGVESEISGHTGIIVKYDSEVGDTYKGSSGTTREVVYKSTTDDYAYGFYYIKVMKVEESPTSIPGVSKIVYIANHKFGIVGIEITLDDNSYYSFSLYSSAEN
jgi:hypothetical protein